MKYFIHDLLTMRKGRIVKITVYDSFQGEVKILKNRLYKWFVEIQSSNISFCYPNQRLFRVRDRQWIYRKDLFRDNSYIGKKRQIDDSDLPF